MPLSFFSSQVPPNSELLRSFYHPSSSHPNKNHLPLNTPCQLRVSAIFSIALRYACTKYRISAIAVSDQEQL